jgi:hypothetical protein
MDVSFSFRKPPGGGGGPNNKPNPFAAAEEQFNAIRGCGITPHPKVTLATLTEGQNPESFIVAPFVYMLSVMGGLNDEGGAFSDDVWLFNPQSIGDTGHYTFVISHLMRIAKGALPLEDVADAFDPENNAASITFTLEGEAVQWDVAVEDGMVAPEVLSGLAGIAAERGDGARLAWADVEGQRLVVFLNETDLADLASTTGMEWGFIE